MLTLLTVPVIPDLEQNHISHPGTM